MVNFYRVDRGYDCQVAILPKVSEYQIESVLPFLIKLITQNKRKVQKRVDIEVLRNCAFAVTFYVVKYK